MDQDRAKQLAALSAVDAVQSGTAIGIGTGSTVRFVIEEIDPPQLNPKMPIKYRLSVDVSNLKGDGLSI